MILQKMKVSYNNRVAPGHWAMGLNWERSFENVTPGQFVMIQIPRSPDLVLRRPFSICRLVFEKGRMCGIEILYRIVGKGTARMGNLSKGDLVDVLGPLGKGFDIPENIRSAFIVGGGIGIAPLIFLLSALSAKTPALESVSVFLGARSKDEILCLGEIEKAQGKGAALHVTTDDGSLGEKGLVTALLEKYLNEKQPDMLYACGPLPMLEKVADLAAKSGTRCQVSMEAMMACGMGACLGCAAGNEKLPDHYAHVCLDGPVFDLDRFGFSGRFSG